jgi:hypothetical protein
MESPIDDLTRRIRGQGEFIVVANQTLLTLRDALKNNVYIQFMLGATNSVERTAMGRSIGLREDQWEDALNLDKPRAFVSVEGKKPLLISIPKYRMPERPPNPDRLITSPNELPFEPVTGALREYVQRSILKIDHPLTMTEVKQERETLDRKKILELLYDVATNPFTTLTSRTNLSFGKSRSDLFRVAHKAGKEKLVNHIAIKATRGAGSKGLYLELTPTGMDLLVENDLWTGSKPYYKGKMGFIGSLLLHEVLIPYYEDFGMQPILEGVNKGYDCDLGILGTEDFLDTAVELSVFTSARQELANVRRDFDAGWQEVTCVLVAFEKNKYVITESEEKTSEKMKAFKRCFKDNLSKDELDQVTVANIKDFRTKRRKK